MTPTEAQGNVKQVVEKTVTKINRQVRSRGTKVKNALRNAELEVLKGKRNGKKYHKPFSKRRYTASAPGEAPARRTGTLRLGWTGGVETTSNRGGVEVIAYIESNTLYAEYLDKGTVKMQPRPFIEKIKEKAEPEIQKIMSENYS